MVKAVMVAAVVAALSGGCVNVQQSSGNRKIRDPEVLAQIVEGKTDKASVEKLLGKPNAISFYENKDELWSYNALDMTAKGSAFSLQHSTLMHTLTVRFDATTGLVVQKGLGETKA